MHGREGANADIDDLLAQAYAQSRTDTMDMRSKKQQMLKEQEVGLTGFGSSYSSRSSRSSRIPRPTRFSFLGRQCGAAFVAAGIGLAAMGAAHTSSYAAGLLPGTGQVAMAWVLQKGRADFEDRAGRQAKRNVFASTAVDTDGCATVILH